MTNLLRLTPLALIISVALGTACERPKLDVPGAKLSGSVKINAALKPLLPPPAGATGRTVAEVEPNTVAPQHFDAGSVEPDVEPLIVTGAMDPVDLRDRILFQVAGDVAASVTLTFEYTEGGGQTNIFFVDGEILGDTNVLAQTAASDAEPSVTVSAVVQPNRPLLVQLRFLSEACKYKLTLNAVGGTVVGKVYVLAMRAGEGHPAFLPDPVHQPKFPVGGVLVDKGIRIDPETGDWTGAFENLPVVGAAEGDQLVLFAYADNDGSGASSGANFVLAPLTPADFQASTLVNVDTPAEGAIRDGLELVIDKQTDDQDMDGAFDDDRNGDGVADDNCPTKANPLGADGLQSDEDGDGVGDVCDNCPSVFNPDQANTDGFGRGDACNDDGGETCPFLGMYPVASCSVDGEAGAADRDEIEDFFLACADGVAACLPADSNPDGLPVSGPPQVLDNCPEADNPTQQDTDDDGAGDACDDDDDNDGDADDRDNCPTTANANQEDTDDDGAGNVCDNCPALANADQGDTDGDGLGNACDADEDGDGLCNEGRTPAADEAGCTGIDNCPSVANGGQVDSDGDGVGDACDLCPTRTLDSPDDDNDGIGDLCEPVACVGVDSPRAGCLSDADCANAGGICLEGGRCLDAIDTDGDGLPDACDQDDDGDDVPDDVDNCVGVTNRIPQGASDQLDADDDGVGDACDNCPDNENVDQRDSDGDGVGDSCDSCRFVTFGPVGCETDADCADAGGRCAENRQCTRDLDSDSDGKGDACDPDDDGDGVCDPCGAAPLAACRGAVANPTCAGADNCPALANPDQADGDQSGVGDACEDADGDGIPDSEDDDDEDGILNVQDNCPSDPNDAQTDGDGDGVGDVCDTCPGVANDDQADSDGDGIGDVCDNCLAVPNPDQRASDDDALGDACDLDADDDGKSNDEDNCPAVANFDQLDSDGDEAGDACDVCTGLPNPSQVDFDGDGLGDQCDNCVRAENPDQADGDNDFVGDACDVCPSFVNRDQADNDGDGLGDPCDDDDDNDGTGDGTDNCPLTANADQSNIDSDGAGDACDDDVDGDGRPNDSDVCATTPNSSTTVQVDDQGGDLSNDPGNPDVLTGSGAGGSLGISDAIIITGTVGDTDVADHAVLASIDNGTALVLVQTLEGAGDVTVAVQNTGEDFGGGPTVATGDDVVIAVTSTDGEAHDYRIAIRTGGTTDVDADGEPDVCDVCVTSHNVGDTDGDGTDDACDACIVAAGSCAGIDDDNDTICNLAAGMAPQECAGADDNCPAVANANQADFNDNGIGDACDDVDGDDVVDADDNCLELENADQADADNDGVGDACDNCDADANADQNDADGDDTGDACDACPVAAGADCSRVDEDGDGACEDPALGAGCPAQRDNCPEDANADQADADRNGLGDACNDDEDADGDEWADDLDNCPTLSNGDQANLDGDDRGDVCDTDVDGDGACNDQPARDGIDPRCNGIDNCPQVANPDQADADGDDIGDVCDISIFTPTIADQEPNDDAAAPQELGFLLAEDVLAVTGTIGESQDLDIFRVRVPHDGVFSAFADWDSGADVGIYLLNPQYENNFDGDAGGPGEKPELLSQQVLAGEELIVAVVGFGPGSAQYTLGLRITDEERLDILAANSLGTIRVGQSKIAIGHMGPERGDPSLIGGAEIDVYRITADADGTLDVALAFDAAIDLDFIVWSSIPGGDPAQLLNTDGADFLMPERAALPLTAGQTVFISVHSYGLALGDLGIYELTAVLQ